MWCRPKVLTSLITTECLICKAGNEDLYHMFVDCPMKRSFWIDALAHFHYPSKNPYGKPLSLSSPSIIDHYPDQFYAVSVLFWQSYGAVTGDVLSYADDLEVFLTSPNEWPLLMDLLRLYHQASNAKVNLTKTVVMPLSGEPQQDWITLAEGGLFRVYLRYTRAKH